MKARLLIPLLGMFAFGGAMAADAGAPATPGAATGLNAPAADAPPVEKKAAPAAQPVQVPKAAPKGAMAAPADKPDAAPQFVRDPALEEMRYQHLWVAYGAIWLIIFFFVFRTWRQGERTAGELEDLKQRLADLEASDDRG